MQPLDPAKSPKVHTPALNHIGPGAAQLTAECSSAIRFHCIGADRATADPLLLPFACRMT